MLYSGNEFADSRRHSMWRHSGDEWCVDWSVLETEAGQKRMALVKALCALRHSYPSLSYGVTEMQKDADTLVFTRNLGDETIKATFRFEEPEVLCPAPSGDILLCNNIRECADGLFMGKGGYIVEIIKGEKR